VPAFRRARSDFEVRGCWALRRRGGLGEVDLVARAAPSSGWIGPNGAGKTTFFIVTGLIAPDEGRTFAGTASWTPANAIVGADRAPSSRSASSADDRAGERAGGRIAACARAYRRRAASGIGWPKSLALASGRASCSRSSASTARRRSRAQPAVRRPALEIARARSRPSRGSSCSTSRPRA
jgi:hypothetical protein